MKNTDPRVDAYIAKSAGFAKPILVHLRRLVHTACPEAEETMKWSSPTFMTNGKMMCGIAAFKAHCTFGFWHKEMESVLDEDGARAGGAMGSMGRITSIADLPSEKKLLVYIKKAAKLNESDAPGRPRGATKPATPLEVPPDLAAGLKKSKAAAEAWANFSPSHRNEYIEWISEAKREETRQKRLATTLEWVAEGKGRNWKYESC